MADDGRGMPHLAIDDRYQDRPCAEFLLARNLVEGKRPAKKCV
jgi:hypothetical protein